MNLKCTMAVFWRCCLNSLWTRPKIIPDQLGPKRCWHVAVRLNKLTKLCKQHTLRTFISERTPACLRNTSGHTQTPLGFALYPKQFYSSRFSLGAARVQWEHGSTSTENWRTYKQLGHSWWMHFTQYSAFPTEDAIIWTTIDYRMQGEVSMQKQI